MNHMPLNKRSWFAKPNNFLLIVLLLYGILGVILLPFYKYQVTVDGISYILSAQKLLRGDFYNAITGHWSPLYSILLVPFLYVGLDPSLAVKLINLAAGIGIIISMHLLCFSFSLSNKIRMSILVALVPIVLAFCFSFVSPDPLQTCFLLFYFVFIFARDYTYNIKPGICCGVLGGLAYLSKHFNLPFFLYHFPLMNAILYLKNNSPRLRKTVVLNFMSALALFTLISSPYITAISYKYGKFTFSTTAYANYVTMNPIPPPKINFFIEPPDNSAVSIWDDPYSYFISGSVHIPWSPFASLAAFKHLVRFSTRHMTQSLLILFSFSPMAFVLCCGYLAFLLISPREFAADREMIFLLLAIVPFVAGYCFGSVGVEGRYLMPICFLFVLMGGHVLDRIFQRYSLARINKTILLVAFIASFSIEPAKALYQNLNTGKALYLESLSIRKYIPPGSKLICDSYWYESLFLTYHLKSKIYGSTEDMTDSEVDKEIEKYNVEYCIVWDKSNRSRPFFRKFAEVNIEGYVGQKVFIYKRKDH